MAGEAWFSGVAVSAAVLWAGSLATAGLAGERSVEFESVVTSVRDDGRTVCVERTHDACGLRIAHPDRAERLAIGDRVRVTEIWLDSGEGSDLAFRVRSV